MAFRAKVSLRHTEKKHCTVLSYFCNSDNSCLIEFQQAVGSVETSAFSDRVRSVELLQTLKIDIAEDALHALDNAVNTMTPYFGEEIDLTPEGQTKITEAQEKYGTDTQGFAREVFKGPVCMHN